MSKRYNVMFNDYEYYFNVVWNGILLLQFLETYEITAALVTHDRVYFANTREFAKFRELRFKKIERNTIYKETRCIAISDVP